MGTAENKDIVRRVYEEVVNNHNLDLLGNYFTPDYVNHKNPGGLEGTRQLFVMLFEAFPDVRVSVDSLGAEGDRVWVRITMQGTQHGPFMGMPPRQDVCGHHRQRAAVGERQGRRGMGRHRHPGDVAAARAHAAGNQLT